MNDNHPLEDDSDYPPCTFEQWLDHFFAINASNWEEYWDTLNLKDYIPDCSNDDAAYLTFFTRLFNDPLQHLSLYTDDQIKRGLWTIINEIGEGGIYALANLDLPWEKRKHAILAMYNVYEKIFEPRCSATLAHLNEADKNPLNSVCYMWWDIIGLPSNQPQLDETAIDVMERTLKLKNIACLEGALHGLGHYQHTNKERVQAIIDQFLADNPDLPDSLRQYALNARHGAVQ